ncbi:MAG: YfiR family protein [Luteitalea sp.]
MMACEGPGSLTTWTRTAVRALVLGLACLVCAAPVEARSDDAARAATIARMLRFVEWDVDAPGGALTVAVVGNPALGAALREACAAMQPGGRTVSVVDVPSSRGHAIANAAVVVLGAGSATLASRLSNQGVLTVGDGDCPDNGLVLNLRHDGQRYSFSANPAVAAKAGVSLSSRLLRLAHIVN